MLNMLYTLHLNALRIGKHKHTQSQPHKNETESNYRFWLLSKGTTYIHTKHPELAIAQTANLLARVSQNNNTRSTRSHEWIW